MKKENKVGFRSEEGFTIIELTIVIAIMGVLSAILVPSFKTMSSKAKIKADINTIKNVQAQIDLYEIETDEKNMIVSETGLVEGAVATLVEGGYIKKSDTNDSKTLRLQSGADLGYNTTGSHIQLNLKDATSVQVAYVEGMPLHEKEWITAQEVAK